MTDRVDEEYHDCLRYLRSRVERLPDSECATRCRLWLERLCSSPPEEWPERNAYLRELCCQLAAPLAGWPFGADPPAADHALPPLNLPQENKKLRARLDEAREDMARKSHEEAESVRTLTEEVRVLRAKLDSLNGAKSMLERNLQQELGHWRRVTQDLRGHLVASIDQQESRERELELLRDEHERTVAHLREEVDAWKQRAEDLEERSQHQHQQQQQQQQQATTSSPDIPALLVEQYVRGMEKMFVKLDEKYQRKIGHLRRKIERQDRLIRARLMGEASRGDATGVDWAVATLEEKYRDLLEVQKSRFTLKLAQNQTATTKLCDDIAAKVG